jgi:hypothetical protein
MQHDHQVALVPDQGPVQQLTPAAGRRVDPGVLEDLPHHRRRHDDAEPGKLAVDPPVPP